MAIQRWWRAVQQRRRYVACPVLYPEGRASRGAGDRRVIAHDVRSFHTLGRYAALRDEARLAGVAALQRARRSTLRANRAIGQLLQLSHQVRIRVRVGVKQSLTG